MKESIFGNLEKDLRDFMLCFGFPRNLVYNTCNTKDMRPAIWFEMEDKKGYECVCRTVGINPNDVKIELKDDCILVSGESKYEGAEYNTRYELPLSREVISNIKDLKFKSLNGLTYIYVFLDRIEKNKIIAERI